MSEDATEKKTLRSFAEHLNGKSIYLNAETMADEFVSFFPHCHLPSSQYGIESFCQEIGVDEIGYSAFPKNIRGFHSIAPDGKITITLDKSGWAGRAHTLYHEIYEIVCEIMEKPELKTEYKANLFSASVIMPEDNFFQYIIIRNLMMSEIKEYYSEISTDSILLRINHLFKKRGIAHTAFLLKNNKAYKRTTAEHHKRIADFQLCLSTLDRLDSINNDGFINKLISDSYIKIIETPLEEVSLVYLHRPGYQVLAEPILFDGNDAIKEIAIQMIPEDTYSNLRNLLGGGTNECSPICKSIL